ncbi:hypothetical protein [Rhodoblastus sp.]|jgi:membrane protease YdiL (CAAX protease family)|nr:hypothetical protein [Rhodoblastus sp.]
MIFLLLACAERRNDRSLTPSIIAHGIANITAVAVVQAQRKNEKSDLA